MTEKYIVRSKIISKYFMVPPKNILLLLGAAENFIVEVAWLKMSHPMISWQPNTKQYKKLLPCEPRMFWDSFTDHWQRLHHALGFHNDDISSMNSLPLNIFICDFLLWYDAEINNQTNYINFRNECRILWTVVLAYLTP